MNKTDKRRAWQEAAAAKWREHKGENFLLTATMGSGKTRWAIEQLKEAFESGRINFCIIVVPTNAIRTNWRETAHDFGLELSIEYRNDMGKVDPNYHGIVISYSQMASNDDAIEKYARECRNKRVAVVLDEVHHLGGDLTWARAAQSSFRAAEFRLLLSGTPFRTDQAPIPFVPYGPPDDAGGVVAHADYSYSYYQAVIDNTCRQVYFPRYEGRMTWREQGQTVERQFGDASLSDGEVGRALRTALQPTAGGWLEQFLHIANDDLTAMRNLGDNRAGGLVVAIDQKHAQDITRMLTSITGQKPVLVISDEPLSQERLDAFSKSTDRWLVSVKMVAEGVDITRLRELVYASDIVAPMFVNQTFGRVIRWDKKLGDEQMANIHVPADERLLKTIREFQAERDRALTAQTAFSNVTDDWGSGNGTQKPKVSDFIPLTATNATHIETLGHGETYTPEELAYASAIGEQTHAGVAAVKIADILRAAGATIPQQSTVEIPVASIADDEIYEVRVKKLRASIQSLATGLAYRMQNGRPLAIQIDLSDCYKALYSWLADRTGAWVREADENQLKAAIKYLIAAKEARELPGELQL